jgi:hypothetical protein
VPNLYVVPGFLSSELFEDALHTLLLWADYNYLMQGTIGKTRLASNGIDPGPPDGRQLYSGLPLLEYWREPTKLLREQLAPHGYEVFSAGWDWRKDFYLAGEALASKIESAVTSDNPCTIVAHSLGGLVARRAWDLLSSVNQSAKIRRIITLGTPHQGSYAAVLIASGDAEYFEQIQFLSNFIANGTLRSRVLGYFPSFTTDELRDLSLTWPTVYQLFPLLGGSAAAGDNLRPLLFARSNWPSKTAISEQHLANAKDVIGPWLLSPASMPPPSVLTTVSGFGLPTPNKLLFPELLGTPGAIGFTDQGDGSVTTSSAEVADSAVYTLECRHADLPLTTAASGDLARWVLDPRSEPTPPPPAAIAGPLVPGIAGPPIASSFGGGSPNPACRRGERCTC